MTITADPEPNRSAPPAAAAASATRTGEPNHRTTPTRTTANRRTEPPNHPDPNHREPANRTTEPPRPEPLPAGWLPALLIMLGTGVAIAAAAFWFSFTNVKLLGIDLGVAKSVAPWVAPTVDLGVVGLAIAVQYLALAGIRADRLKGAHHWLIFSGVLTLALNSAPALIAAVAGHDPRALGRGLYEAVAPAMLIGWTKLLPNLVQMYVELRTGQRTAAHIAEVAAAASEAELARLDAEAKATAARLDAELAAEARRAEFEAAAAARQHEADLERRRLELAAAQAAAEADRRAAAAQRAADLERERLAAERAAAEADRARNDAAAAEANRAAAEAARAAAATRTTPDRRKRAEPAQRTTRTEPANRTTEPAGNVVAIAKGADAMRAALTTLYGALRPSDNVHSWDDVWTENTGFKIGINELNRRSGIRKPTLYQAVKHAQQMYPWPGDPADAPTEEETG